MKDANAALLLAGILAGSSGSGVMDMLEAEKDRSDRNAKAREDRRMPLTEEELEKLASLSGKEKKAYVKELRAQYAKAL